MEMNFNDATVCAAPIHRSESIGGGAAERDGNGRQSENKYL